MDSIHIGFTFTRQNIKVLKGFYLFLYQLRVCLLSTYIWKIYPSLVGHIWQESLYFVNTTDLRLSSTFIWFCFTGFRQIQYILERLHWPFSQKRRALMFLKWKLRGMCRGKYAIFHTMWAHSFWKVFTYCIYLQPWASTYPLLFR